MSVVVAEKALTTWNSGELFGVPCLFVGRTQRVVDLLTVDCLGLTLRSTLGSGSLPMTSSCAHSFSSIAMKDGVIPAA